MRLLFATLFALLAGPALALAPTSREVVTWAIEQAIRPGFADYAEATAGLEQSLEAACQTSDAAAVEASRSGFKSVVGAWSRIELYRLGPLLVGNRADSILFWPDRKGIALKQVQAILAGEDQSVLDPATLKAKSVAVQGLGALEYLLFGTGAEQLTTAAGGFRCGYAKAIARLLAGTAAEMSAEWTDPEGISKRLIYPDAADTDYRSDTEVKQALVGLLAHGIEAIRDQRILPFLGRDGEAPKPKSALFWRSGMSVPSVLGNFEGLRLLFEKSDIWEYTSADNLWVGNSARFEFANAARAGALIVDPVEAALADAKQKHALDYLVLVSQSLGKLMGESLPAALGLSVGFSSLDGD